MSIDVSVIIPAWKAAAFVERAIASALGSTGVSVEVVAVDDASPDATFAVLRRLAAADTRIVAERLPQNSGPSAARNRAIDLANGRYIAILDADDAMKPDRLAALVALAEKTHADIIVDNMTEVGETGEALSALPFLKSRDFASTRTIDLETWVKFNQPLKPVDCLGYLKPLIRRAKLAETGIRYDEELRNSEDYYLVADLLARGARMTYTPGPGYLYQRSSASTSHRLQPAHTRAWLDAEQRFHDRYHGRFTSRERSALKARGKHLRDVNQFVSAIDAVQKKQVGEFFGLLVGNPLASRYTISTFAKIAAGKALRRKFV